MRGSVICFPMFTLLWDCQHIGMVSSANTAVVALTKPHVGKQDDATDAVSNHPAHELTPCCCLLDGAGGARLFNHWHWRPATVLCPRGVHIPSTTRDISRVHDNGTTHAQSLAHTDVLLSLPRSDTRVRCGVWCSTQRHAISTFNVLASEGRSVAAALISQEPVTREEACAYEHMLLKDQRYRNGGEGGSDEDHDSDEHYPRIDAQHSS